MTDFFLLLMLANAGDELQGIKRGIVEMCDMIAAIRPAITSPTGLFFLGTISDEGTVAALVFGELAGCSIVGAARSSSRTSTLSVGLEVTSSPGT